MENKHIVITGAGSGLGASLAKKYAAEGHFITLIGRNTAKLEKVAASFLHQEYAVCPLDVASYEAVEEVFTQIVQKGKPIDMLINNAGVGYFELAEKLTSQQVNKMIDINLKGTIFCTQQVLSSMKEHNRGSIVNIVSTAGLTGKVTESVYCASKFGVKGFTDSLLKELVDTAVHVTAVYMGGMATPFWEGVIPEENLGKFMHPDDVADIIMNSIQARKNINVPQIVIEMH